MEQAWRVDRLKAGIRYRIENTHPSISAVIENAGPLLSAVEAMLKVIEETVPVQRIWLDTAEQKETPRTGFLGEPSETVVSVLKTLFADMIGRRGMSVDAAKRMLHSTEPFQNFPELVSSLATDDPTQDKHQA